MAAGRYRHGYRIKGRFILILVGLMVLVAALWFFLSPAPAEALSRGAMNEQWSFPAVIVREESVKLADSYGHVTYDVAEGSRISQGADVCQIYKQGYSEKTLQELESVREEIRLYQEQNLLGDVVDRDLTSMDAARTQTLLTLGETVRAGDALALLDQENALRQQMGERMAYMNKTAQADEKLQQLYDREAELQARSNEAREVVTADQAGVISFYIDGCETLLTPSAIEQMTVTDVKNIIKQAKSRKSTDAKTQQPLFRLVNSNRWYVLMMAEGNRSVQPNEAFTLTLSGMEVRQVEATAISSRYDETKNTTLIALMVQEDIGEFLSVREVTCTLTKEYEGFKVPSKWIKVQDGIATLKVRRAGGQEERVQVKVWIDNGQTAIVAPVIADSLKENDPIVTR